MNIKPLRTKLIVRQDLPKEKLSSGLYLPQGSRDLHDDTGTVEAIGSEVEHVKVGDRVAFKRRPASHLGDLKAEWKDLLILEEEEDIIGVLENA